MLDLRFVRDNLPIVEDMLEKRGYEPDLSRFESLDKRRRQIIRDLEEMRAKRNTMNKEIGEKKRKGEDTSKIYEEMKELFYSVGVEYWYDKVFALRGGFFYEDKSKGGRQFFTIGAGLKYNVFALDFSYLIPTEQHNPLEHTLRFSLSFDFDAFTAQNKDKKIIK